MDLVVDANVIFAAIIKEGKTHELLFRAIREKQDKIRVYSTGILDKMLE